MAKYFLDVEFNGWHGDLISLALVGLDDRALYISHHCDAPVDWVQKNVIPIITCAGATPHWVLSANMMGYMIAHFLRDDASPVIVADWPDDISYFCRAIITGPGEMVAIQRLQFEMVRIDAYPTKLPGAVQHNALWDARALRHAITTGKGT